MYLNPVLEFLYWHMNFHVEHHMYAAVPCYRLRNLHETIKHELPPALAGLAATWQEIIAIQYRQKQEPGYAHTQRLPGAATQAAQQEIGAPERTTRQVKERNADNPGRVWECSICGFVYSESLGLPEAGIPPGTAWEDVPEDWVCPDCGTAKSAFEMKEVR
jgi:rubredoxin